MEISFIIPNYKSEHYLANCIASIEKHAQKGSYEIIIVNNDDQPLEKDDWNANIHILDNKNNAGFSKACNLGASIAKGDILFFLNPDTEIKTGNISDLALKLEDSLVGIVAPKLTLPNGDTQPWSCGCEVNLWDIIKNNFGIIKSKRFWSEDTPAQVSWVSGAGFLIKKSLFATIGGFDENFFMYFEDVDLCKKVTALKKKIIVMPCVQVMHLGGQSFSNSTKQKGMYYSSQDYYFKKHFGLFHLSVLQCLRRISLFFKK